MSDSLKRQIEEIKAQLIVQEKFNMQTLSYPLNTKFEITYRVKDKVEQKIFYVYKIELRDKPNYYLRNSHLNREIVIIYKDVYFIEVPEKVTKILKIEKLKDHI